MFSPITYLKTPEYLFRPQQACRRLQRIWRKPQPLETITLPWGAQIQIRPDETIGRQIHFYGIHDKVVPETIARLLDAGELAIEVGANLGQNSSLMALLTGPKGRTIAFEPHPEIFRELQASAQTWQRLPGIGPLQLERIAIGTREGEAVLVDGDEFAGNRGTARLESNGGTAGRSFRVSVRPLDSYIPEGTSVGVCKVDVEGNELDVLQGTQGALKRRAVRDLIFEDFNPQPSKVVEFLRGQGFEIFQLREGWLKPAAIPLSQSPDIPPHFTYNFLATLNPQRVAARFEPAGWRCLRRHPKPLGTAAT